MKLFKRRTTLGLGCVGAFIAFATIRAGAQPDLPKLAPQPGGALPSPLDLVKPPAPPPLPSLPALPPERPNPVPPVLSPYTPESIPPIAPPVYTPFVPPVPDFAITEPIATIHRFENKYLGAYRDRVWQYVLTKDGKAEIQSQLLTQAIPPGDPTAKDDVKRIEVPRGQVQFHGGRVLVVTSRDLLVIDSECKLDWKFTLPGKPDNGERIIGIAGFDGENVIIASHHEPKPNTTVKPSGRVMGFDKNSGRQTRFITVENGFDANAEFVLDTSGQLLVAVNSTRALIYPLTTGTVAGTALPFPKMPVKHLQLSLSKMVASTPQGICTIRNGVHTIPLPDCVGTAPTALADKDGGRFFAPVKSKEGHLSIVCVNVFGTKTPEWSLPVSKEITAAPVLRSKSVYFVAGNVIYRVNASDGAICWKQTLALNAGKHSRNSRLWETSYTLPAAEFWCESRIAENPSHYSNSRQSYSVRSDCSTL